MSDDFGTVNIKRGDQGREIEVLRQHYRQHRESLVRMAAEAPTEHLATEYHRLIRDIDGSMRKLDELDGRPSSSPPKRTTDPGTRPGVALPPPPPPRPDAGARPLVHANDGDETVIHDSALPNPQSRVLLIVVAAVLVVGLIGWMIYRASRDRRHPDSITETTTTTVTAPAPVAEPVAPPPAAGVLAVTPASADYGSIRKGTRAVRQFEVTNGTTSPMAIKISRSNCKCLFYDYREALAAKGKETISVTIDAARVKGNALNETVQISSKKDPSVNTSFNVVAAIK